MDPPAAIGLFAVIAKVTPDSWGTRGVQAAAALVVVLTTLLIGLGLARDGRDSGLAVLYAASPVALFEAANSAHTEAFAAAALVAAAVWSHRHLLAGALVGLAGGLAFTPLLMLPAVASAKLFATIRTWVGGVVVFVAGYVPHVLLVGWLAVGYLPQYLKDQGYIDGDRGYDILRLVPQLPVRRADLRRSAARGGGRRAGAVVGASALDRGHGHLAVRDGAPHHHAGRALALAAARCPCRAVRPAGMAGGPASRPTAPPCTPSTASSRAGTPPVRRCW